MLIPMFLMIGIWGGERRIYATIKFFLYTAFGSILMLAAVIYLVWSLQTTTGAVSFAFADLLKVRLPLGAQSWLLAAFALSFAIKVPMVPLHTWLPDAHVEAPTAGSVVLAGVLLKMGTYGFVRFALPLFPAAAAEWTPVMLALALAGVIYGALVAMVQDDIKKLVAYSSVAHLGFVMLGIFAMNPHGLNGGVLQMVNHGLSTGALFLLVGMLYERRHTRQIADFGGIAKPMPVFAAFFGLVTMSSIGLPALNGFVGEFLILLGAFLANPAMAIVATSGVVLGAVYMLWMFRRVFFGPLDSPENRGLIDLGLREKLVMAAIAVPILWIGVYPETFLRRIEPSVVELLRRVEERSALHVAAPGTAGPHAYSTLRRPAAELP
jgi:NADH-quinone oxidoreductase subunit M